MYLLYVHNTHIYTYTLTVLCCTIDNYSILVHCMYIHICTCVHVWTMYIYIHNIILYICMYVCVHSTVQMCTVCVHVHVCTCMYILYCTYMHVCVVMYVCTLSWGTPTTEISSTFTISSPALRPALSAGELGTTSRITTPLSLLGLVWTLENQVEVKFRDL